MKSEADKEIEELTEKGDTGCKYFAKCETCPFGNEKCPEDALDALCRKIKKGVDKTVIRFLGKLGKG